MEKASGTESANVIPINRAYLLRERAEAQNTRDLEIANRLAKKVVKAAVKGRESVDVRTGFERLRFLGNSVYRKPSVIGATNELLEPERLRVSPQVRVAMVESPFAALTGKAPTFVPKDILSLEITTVPPMEQQPDLGIPRLVLVQANNK